MTLRAKYDGTCTKCGGYLPAGTEIEWEKGKGATHVTCPAPTEFSVGPLDMQPIAAFIQAARDRGLKFPRLRVLHPNDTDELTLGLTQKGLVPGSISVKWNGEYLGSIRPSGAVAGKLRGHVDILRRLDAVAKDPAAAAKAYAVLKSRCSFCGLPLTDEGSVEVGYGPVCAKKWGLPHSPKGTPALAVPDSPGVLISEVE